MLYRVTSTNVNGTQNQSPYLLATGRFGLSIEKEKEFSHRTQINQPNI